MLAIVYDLSQGELRFSYGNRRDGSGDERGDALLVARKLFTVPIEQIVFLRPDSAAVEHEKPYGKAEKEPPVLYEKTDPQSPQEAPHVKWVASKSVRPTH